MSTGFIFKTKDAKKGKIFNFLKGRFSVMGGPMHRIFGFFRDLCEASKNYNFTIFLKI